MNNTLADAPNDVILQGQVAQFDEIGAQAQRVQAAIDFSRIADSGVHRQHIGQRIDRLIHMILGRIANQPEQDGIVLTPVINQAIRDACQDGGIVRTTISNAINGACEAQGTVHWCLPYSASLPYTILKKNNIIIII